MNKIQSSLSTIDQLLEDLRTIPNTELLALDSELLKAMSKLAGAKSNLAKFHQLSLKPRKSKYHQTKLNELL
jgi:hypothetical protein